MTQKEFINKAAEIWREYEKKRNLRCISREELSRNTSWEALKLLGRYFGANHD